MIRKDWLLLTLNAAGAAGLSPVQLQKALFVFGAKMKKISPDGEILTGEDTFYSFRPYDYGPFSKAIYGDAEDLALMDSIDIKAAQSCSRKYQITEHGRQAAATLQTQVAPNEAAYLQKIVTWVQSLSFDDLLRSVYSSYPEMASRSVFRG